MIFENLFYKIIHKKESADKDALNLFLHTHIINILLDKNINL